MALFGKGKEELAAQKTEQELAREKKEELYSKLDEKRKAVEATIGVSGKGEDGPFEKDRLYKFKEDGNKYVFYQMPTEKYMLPELSDIENELNKAPIEFEKDKYVCSLVEETLPLEKDKELVGEGILTVSPIRLCFKEMATGSESFFNVTNSPNNIAPMADFFQSLGVKNYYNVFDLPKEIYSVKVDKGNNFFASNRDYFVFRDKGILTFIRPSSSGWSGRNTGVRIVEVGIDEILYYKSEGSVRYEQLVSGSGGAENSYTGAIIGGLLFGAAGAIIGSRANETKTEISTTTVTHDTRILVLSIKRNTEVFNVSFDLSAETVLEWLIPEKKYEYVIQKRREMYEQDPMK